MQWLAGLLRIARAPKTAAALAEGVPDAGGVYLVPAFAGLGAPHWDAGARGVIFGLTRGTTAAHIARATIDSIAYQVYDVFEAMRQDAAIPLPALFADGGASRNDSLMQFQADILGLPGDSQRFRRTSRPSARRGWPGLRRASGIPLRGIGGAAASYHLLRTAHGSDTRRLELLARLARCPAQGTLGR